MLFYQEYLINLKQIVNVEKITHTFFYYIKSKYLKSNWSLKLKTVSLINHKKLNFTYLRKK